MASAVLAPAPRRVAPPEDWGAIRQPATPLVVTPRDLGGLAGHAARLVADAPFELRAEGTVGETARGLGDLPAALRQDIAELATRFAALMAVPAVRIRLEGIITNACRKIHSDNTDVRLITTYCGPGTDYVPGGMEPDECNLRPIPTGWVALFKGRTFHPDHAFCLHRSPPAGDMAVARLVLVIDTPLRPDLAALAAGQSRPGMRRP